MSGFTSLVRNPLPSCITSRAEVVPESWVDVRHVVRHGASPSPDSRHADWLVGSTLGAGTIYPRIPATRWKPRLRSIGADVADAAWTTATVAPASAATCSR